MQRKSQSVRLVSDTGDVVTVDPDHDGKGEPVVLEVEEQGVPDAITARVELDGETADALADAIDEARGRRKRQRGRVGEGEQGGPQS
jgi:hypothetical protein